VPSDSEKELAAEVGEYTHDPFGFVRTCFPWGVPGGPLADRTGPEPWQRKVLEDIGTALQASDNVVRVAVASGHGVGKSALVAWLILWAMATCPDTRAAITANTEPQLRTKTWPELMKWHRLSTVGRWFTCTATSLYRADDAKGRTWRADALTWTEHNTEAFAGLHNVGSRILLVFDEASAIADQVWEVAEGALTDKDTEIVWVAFGNPTRTSGRFRECHDGGRYSHRWRHHKVDSRTVSFTNKDQIDQWVADYGEDSDFVRVRVRGEFPRAGSTQFIASDVAEAASQRSSPAPDWEPVVIGVDVARFGDDESVIWRRQGRDAASAGPARFRRLDTMALASRVAEAFAAWNARAVIVDEGGVGGGVVDRLRQLLPPEKVHGVNFGGKAERWSPDGVANLYANRGAECWGIMREWLASGGCIPADDEIVEQLTGRSYGYNARNEIQLERKDDMKKRGLASPDIADALALTFAVPIQPYDAQTFRMNETAFRRLRSYVR
jgi:hypothetical protein